MGTLFYILPDILFFWIWCVLFNCDHLYLLLKEKMHTCLMLVADQKQKKKILKLVGNLYCLTASPVVRFLPIGGILSALRCLDCRLGCSET